jgi:6-phosphogluconolactonase
VQHRLVTVPNAEALARAAAAWVAERLRRNVGANGRCTFAVSGGSTPWAMFAELRRHDVPWVGVEIVQVDERVAPAGDDARNMTHLRRALDGLPVTVTPMPVEADDLDQAADAYAARLPARLDLVHLGLGLDGHTASLVPGDPVLEVTDRLVAVTGPYDGHRRMTLTYPALARADELLWLVAGADKAPVLRQLLANDPAIPAGRVRAPRSTILADEAAAPVDRRQAAPPAPVEPRP